MSNTQVFNAFWIKGTIASCNTAAGADRCLGHIVTVQMKGCCTLYRWMGIPTHSCRGPTKDTPSRSLTSWLLGGALQVILWVPSAMFTTLESSRHVFPYQFVGRCHEVVMVLPLTGWNNTAGHPVRQVLIKDKVKWDGKVRTADCTRV